MIWILFFAYLAGIPAAYFSILWLMYDVEMRWDDFESRFHGVLLLAFAWPQVIMVLPLLLIFGLVADQNPPKWKWYQRFMNHQFRLILTLKGVGPNNT